EEQFYLVWPLLFLVLARWRAGWVQYFVWTAAAISFAAFSFIVGRDRQAAFFLAPFRTWELLLAAALALLPRRPARSPGLADLASRAGLVMIVTPSCSSTRPRPFPASWPCRRASARPSSFSPEWTSDRQSTGCSPRLPRSPLAA